MIMSAKDLYNLDPASRLDLCFSAEDGLDKHAQQIYDGIKDDVFMVRLRQIAWERFKTGSGAGSSSGAAAVSMPPKPSGIDIKLRLKNDLEDLGLKEVLVNSVVRLYERNTAINMHRGGKNKLPVRARKSADEAVASIRDARVAWELGINEELLAIATELNRPLNKDRVQGGGNPFLGDGAPPAGPAGKDAVRFIYDSDDLYETSIAIKGAKARTGYVDRSLQMIRLDGASAPSLLELSKRYSELNPQMTQLGLDDSSYYWGNKLSVARHEEGEAIAAYGNALHARRFMRRGVPPALRCRIWRVAFGLPDEPSAEEEAALARLRQECHDLDLLTDQLFIHDVQTVVDDPRFFVFEEELRETVLCLSRDEWLRSNCEYEVHKPLLGFATPSQPAGAACPPSGIQPFLGLATYFAPICYVFRDRVSLYSFAKTSFAKLWCRLNVHTSDQGTLLHTCSAFESLLLAACPALSLHLVNIGLNPAQVALPWLQLGFVDLLEVDQLLILWDRVFGYMDATILAVLAVAVFQNRAELLMQCAGRTDAEALLSEGSRLKVVPLLQMSLFVEKDS